MIDHEYIDSVMYAGPRGTGTGTKFNPFIERQAEWQRRLHRTEGRAHITDRIRALFEPRFITPPETSEFIEAVITMTDSRRILEVGTYSGFTALHILRAIIGKLGAHVVTVDHRPAFDAEFFAKYADFISCVEGKTPEVLNHEQVRKWAPFDVVFVDSDHSIEHTSIELDALWPLLRPGSIILMHDLPEEHTPGGGPHPVRPWILQQVASGRLKGLILPTCEQLDCLAVFGPGYSPKLNPHLGVFMVP